MTPIASGLNRKDSENISPLVHRLQDFPVTRPEKLMEVCGTHTVAIHRQGIQHLLPPNVKLVSGPGCPVCVTPGSFIDEAILLARRNITIVTFGDLVRVPGGMGSLQQARAEGCDVRVAYSPLEALDIAESGKDTVFLAVGFETTIPAIGITVLEAQKRGLTNFSLLCALRVIPPALEILLSGEYRVDGFLLPGHVSTVLGLPGYRLLEEKHIPGVIAGFEAADIVSSILLLLEMIHSGKGRVVNNYRRVVDDGGNEKSRRIISEVFQAGPAEWRGIGTIPQSGLLLKEEYKEFDARKRFPLPEIPEAETTGCRCGEVLKGLIDPPDCGLFRSACTPDSPRGPCMVSSEGSCHAWFRYG